MFVLVADDEDGKWVDASVELTPISEEQHEVSDFIIQ